MPLKFPYRREPTTAPPGYILRPVAKVTLAGPSRRPIVEFMYIDSGADFTILPYRLGVYLGLRASAKGRERVQGIAGAMEVMPARLKMRIGPHTFLARVAWAQRETVPLLLGRTDVFDRFQIVFHQQAGWVAFHWHGSTR